MDHLVTSLNSAALKIRVALEQIKCAKLDPTNEIKLSSTEFLFNDVMEHFNSVESDILRLVDDYAALSEASSLMSQKVKSLETRLESNDQEINKLREEKSHSDTLAADNRNENADLKQSISLLNKELSKLRLLPPKIDELNRRLEKTERALVKKSNLLTLRDKQLVKKNSDNEELARRLDESEGQTSIIKGIGTKTVQVGEITYYINVLNGKSPQTAHSSYAGAELIDPNWHLQVTSSNGIAVLPIVTRWLTPVFPYCADFSANWSSEVNTATYEIIKEAIEGTELEHLIAYCEKAKSINLRDTDLQENTVSMLKRDNVNDLHDALSLSRNLVKRIVTTYGCPSDNIDPDDVYEQIQQLELKILKEN